MRMRLAIAILALLILSQASAAQRTSMPDSDVLVVGAGISGLSAALEVATGGARVKVIDMWSIFGGHAVMSQGGLSIVGTPVQQSRGITDTPELAYKDFLEWGEDADPEWVRYYVENSRVQIYDWVTAMGIVFDGVSSPPGNSVPRFHQTRGRGLGLVSPIYRECLKNPNITFEWNIKVDGLISERQRVVGVRGEDLRTGKRRELRARVVILATGGFQSNIEMVREFWPQNLPFPERMLAGSGLNSLGSGHAVAQKAGAVLYNMDHQWNYSTGLPDPRYPGGYRGLNASNGGSIWVNAHGKRFVNESGGTKVTFPALVSQKPATYWAIFDENNKRRFTVAGSDWGDFRTVEEIILKNPDIVKSASSIEVLAAAAGLPASTLIESVRRYNEMADKGDDTEFGRFGPGRSGSPQKVEKPPFYAVQFFPLARKSMGGIQIDLQCRVVDRNQRAIPGLYAVGELTGFAGINGNAGLEGTFLGPSIVTGRAAGRAVLEELKIRTKITLVPPAIFPQSTNGSNSSVENASCNGCHDLPQLLRIPRKGYSHFEKVHGVVLERKHDCGQCHAELAPYRKEFHRIDRLAQIDNCKLCHVAEER